MFDFARKLLLARQLNLERGHLEILGYKFIILPADILGKITSYDKKSPKILYGAGKDVGMKFGEGLIKMFHFQLSKFGEVLVNTFELCGWGMLHINSLDWEKHNATLNLTNSPIASTIGNVGDNVCHAFRGIMAGASSKVNKVKLDCIETHCMSEGKAPANLL